MAWPSKVALENWRRVCLANTRSLGLEEQSNRWLPTCVRSLAPLIRGSFQPTNYSTELLDRFKAIECLDDTIQVQG